MSERHKLPVARPGEGSWPKELSKEEIRLLSWGVLHSLTPYLMANVLFVGGIFVSIWYLGNPLRTYTDAWFGVQGGKIARLCVFGVIGGLASLLAMNWNRNARTRRYRNVLLAHGFCPCGYKYVEQGESRSCPECGRQWTAKQPPRE